MMRLRLELFGPVRAWRGGDEVVLGPAQRRTLLAILALKANQVVSRSELIDAIWGENPPASANGSIYTYVSSLRSALDPERTHRTAAEVLASSGPGYCLRVDAESIDVVRFENFRERARSCQRVHDVPGALAALDNALALSREEPLAGLPGPHAAAQRERLRELRLDVVERRARIMLDEGEHQRVLAELRPIATNHPMREGLQSLQLLALYRCGRRADALRAFEELRATMIDELGIEPGRELTLRYEQIKADDPGLWRGRTNTPRVTVAARQSQVDRRSPFVGRQRELTSLRSSVDDLLRGRGASVWLEGELGIGKSELITAALANITDCGVSRGCADELSRHAPLQTILDCLDIKANSPDPRSREVARAVQQLCADDGEAVAAAADLVVGLVANLCRTRPQILVVDDLHWADPASIEVWRRLTAECGVLPLLLIAACRRVPGDHQTDELRAVVAAAGTRVHRLSPLTDAEVRELLTGLTGTAPGPALLELAGTAAGNPLFVRDIVTALGEEKPPQPELTGGRPAIPRTALDAVTRRLGFLSAGASEVLRWAALLDSSFSCAELAVALGRPADSFDRVLDEVAAAGLLVRVRGKLAFRHPVVRQALYARTPTAIRLALHRQLAEALADAGAPVERVASQLLAAPVPIDKWFCEWLARDVYRLAPRSPLATVRLLQRVNTAGTIPGGHRESLGIATARITLWLERDLTAEAGQVAVNLQNPEVVAEMRWLLAYSRLLRGNAGQAAKEIRQALQDAGVPAAWRTMHQALLSRARVSWWPVCTSDVDGRPAPITGQRTASGPNPTDSYWAGHWEAPLEELAQRLGGGPAFARYVLGRPLALRQLSGVAAMIAAHRGRPDDARAHLMSVWVLAPPDELGTDGTDFMLATNALLAEIENRKEVAFGLLASMLEFDDAAVCPWMPALVRLAVELGEHDDAKLATLLCERAPGHETAALRCRALLDDDPLAALTAATRLRSCGNRFGEAQAMEDAAVLLARTGRTVKAEAALRIALNRYDELGAVLDGRRAGQRVAAERQRACA